MKSKFSPEKVKPTLRKVFLLVLKSVSLAMDRDGIFTFRSAGVSKHRSDAWVKTPTTRDLGVSTGESMPGRCPAHPGVTGSLNI